MKLKALTAFYLTLVLLPLFLAWLGTIPRRGIFDELATGAGMLAFSIILVEFILSGRFRSVSSGVGLDVTLRLHQLLARFALVLALVHPFLYRTPFARQLPWDPTRQLTLTPDFWAMAGGFLAWLILPSLILLAIARSKLSYKYETWRIMHGVGALLIVGFVLHHTLNAGRYSEAPVLRFVWLALSVGALATMVFVYLIKPLLQLGRAWSVASVTPVANRMWELRLKPMGHKGLKYKAGQFVWLNLGHSPFSIYENPFSISSAPASGRDLSFIIKELGDSTRLIGNTPVDTTAYLDGPHGNLVVSGRNEPGIALIAGGVGIAPLLGVLRQLKLDKDPRPTVLVYGNRAEDRITYRDELDALSREHGTKVVNVLSEPPLGWTGRTGIMDAKLIAELFQSPEMKDWLYMLCGPVKMMTVAEDQLIELGIPSSQILSERFNYD
jgi:predicted ferric reductase